MPQTAFGRVWGGLRPGWVDPVMTNLVEQRGKSWDSRIPLAWRVSTSQLTLAVRRRCAGGNAQPRPTWGAAPANVGRQPHGGSAARAAPRGCRSGRGQRQSPSRLPWVTMRAGALDRRSRGWARSGRMARRGDDQQRRAAWDVVGLAKRLCVAGLHQPADAGRSPTLWWPQRAAEANVGRQPHGGSAARVPPRGCRSARGHRQTPTSMPNGRSRDRTNSVRGHYRGVSDLSDSRGVTTSVMNSRYVTARCLMDVRSNSCSAGRFSTGTCGW